MVADDTPNREAIGLAHTPTQAPLLQHDNKIGAAEVKPPVMLVQIDFFDFISRYNNFLLPYAIASLSSFIVFFRKKYRHKARSNIFSFNVYQITRKRSVETNRKS